MARVQYHSSDDVSTVEKADELSSFTIGVGLVLAQALPTYYHAHSSQSQTPSGMGDECSL